jgi:hypothetical protein
VEVGRVNGWRTVAKVADPKAEVRVVLKEGNLLGPLIRAAQAKVTLEERAGGTDVGYLQVDVIENHNQSAPISVSHGATFLAVPLLLSINHAN